MKDPNAIRTPWMVKLVRGKPEWVTGILLPLVASGLSACTATKSAMVISAPRTVETSQAMIVPAPGGPRVVSVIEERFSDAVEQKVILGTDADTPGQNYLGIRLYGPMEPETQGTKNLGYKSVSAVSLNNEALRAVPGVAMKTSALFLRNNYGPFGYAFGQSADGDSCIFGWQQLRSTEAERENFRNVGAIQIRLRLCENGASEKELLTVMYGYTVTGTFSSEQWNPFGAPKNVPAKIAGGNPIYPEDSELKAPATIVAVQPARRRQVLIKREVIPPEESAEEENAAKRIVDVPGPAGIDDSSKATDANVESPVLVPGPGCSEGKPSCN